MSYLTKIKNPTAAASSNISARGFRGYFRPYKADGTIDAASQFLFLGATKNYEPSNDEQTREFTANLTGVEETLKTALASRTRTFTFITGSVNDVDVSRLFYGSALVAGKTTNATINAVEDTGTATTGDAILVFETTEGLTAIAYYPSVSLRGTGPGDEDGFATFEFEATIQSAPGFTPPASLVDMQRATPQGVIYLVPRAKVDDFLNQVFTAFSTYTSGS